MNSRTTALLAAAALTAALAPGATAHAAQVPGPPVAPPTADVSTTTPAPAAGAAARRVRSVLIISVDGLNPRALNRLGRKRAPHLHRLLRQGTSTRNARTVVEQTTTLPNHTSIVTGRRIDADQGGHGVDWNYGTDATADTVHEAAGEHVASLFTAADDAGGSTALFAGKGKFRLWKRSWGGAIDRVSVRRKDERLARDVLRDLRRTKRMVRFWHIATPDRAGHRHGAMRPRYLKAVRQVDAMVGRAVRTIRQTPRLRGTTAIVLTSDHGVTKGRRDHDDASLLTNQRVLLVAQGPGIARGADLYALNDDVVGDPGRTQPAYDADLPPVRNGDTANLVLDLLGLPALPGSELNAGQTLTLRR